MAYEYTTTSLVQAELQSTTAFSSSTTPSDSEVTNWIQEESAYINNLADTVFSTTAITSSDPEYIDYDGGHTLVLENGPLISVEQIRYNKNKLGSSAGADWEVQTEDTDFTVYDGDMSMLRILDNWSPKRGLKRIEAQYTYGYTTTPLEVQKLATKLVAQRVLETLINKNVNERNDGGEVEVGPIRIVEPESYGVSSYIQLKSDIENIKEEIVKEFRVQRQAFHLFI